MKKILLVEDNPADVLLTKRVVKQAELDAELLIAGEGVEALEILQDINASSEGIDPALVLMDINMPRKNGKDVLKEIKADRGLRHIPVVMLTTSDSCLDISESYDNFASGYIVKPSRLNDFVTAISALKSFWFDTVQPARR